MELNCVNTKKPKQTVKQAAAAATVTDEELEREFKFVSDLKLLAHWKPFDERNYRKDKKRQSKTDIVSLEVSLHTLKTTRANAHPSATS